MHHTITVIIAAWNEAKKIGRCLDALLAQSYKVREIYVVDDGSTDNTRGVVRSYTATHKHIHLLTQKRQGPGAAKNNAAQYAKGSILVFVDGDEYPRKDYIEKLTKPVREGNAKTAVGAWHVAYPKSPWARCRFKDSHMLRKHGVQSGVFRAIDTAFFNKLGGFDPAKGYSDDRITTQAKRARIDDAIFDHDVDSTAQELYAKRVWIGSTARANPKGWRFKLKVSVAFLIILGALFSLFYYPAYSTYVLAVPLILLGVQTLRKVAFYKDARLLAYYPMYIGIYIAGMCVGFAKSFTKNKPNR